MAFSYNRKSFKKSYQFRKCARAYLRKGRYAPGDYCFFFFVVVYFIKHVMLILTLFKLDLNLAIHIGMMHKWKNLYTTI